MPYEFTPDEQKSYEVAVAAVRANPSLGLVVVDRGMNWREMGHGWRYMTSATRDVKDAVRVFGAGIKEDRRWYSPIGKTDDFGDRIRDTVVDGATGMGPWALMTEESFAAHGRGDLGTGSGQKYRLRPDGVWIKVGG